MIRKKPTLTDIAREAGVSQSTVSLVFSGKGRISPHMRKKVLEIADKLGYKKTTYSNRSDENEYKNIAILIHMDYEYLWNFFHPTISEIETILYESGYNVILIPINFRSDEEQVYNKILTSCVSAVFTLHYARRELFVRLERMGILVVILHNCDFQDRFSSVSFDDLQGAYEATRYLLNLGHRRIAYVEYEHKDLFSIKNDRFFGFKKAMDEFNVEFDESRKSTIDYYNMEQTLSRLTEIFDSEDRPTAVFVHDDYLALRVIQMIRHMGYSVPGDISIIAPGDVLAYSEPHIPQITTMKINTALIGRLAAELMLNRLRNGSDDVQVLRVKEQLVDRGSCKEIRD